MESAAPPPYSPDISPYNYELFLKLKKLFRGHRFPTLNDLNLAMTRHIRELNFNGLLDGVKKLPDRWKCVIEVRGGLHSTTKCEN